MTKDYPMGSISSGTMRKEDLIPVFVDELGCQTGKDDKDHITLKEMEKMKTRKDRLEEFDLHVSDSMNDETFLILDEVWKEYSILHFHGNEVPHVDEYLFGVTEYEGIHNHEKHFLVNFDFDNGVPDRTYETEEGYWAGEAPSFENTYQIQKNTKDRENYKY